MKRGGSDRPPAALVTGGSRGIGLALARLLARDGYRVALLARTDADLDQAVRTLPERERGHLCLPADVADLQAVRRAFGSAVETFGRLHLVVHCAGVLATGRFDAIEIEDYRRLVEINYLGTVHVSREAIAHMLAAGGGHLVQLTSVIAIRTFPGFAAYAPTKSALRTFHETLEMELADSPVRLSLAYPPITDTPMVHALPRGSRPAVYDAFPAVPAERVASGILRGIRKGRRRIFVSSLDWFFFHMTRLAPGTVGRVLDAYVARRTDGGGGGRPPS
jgi:NAD(P)-dependent dehydrogenase (short-subunit alcohol dehydrogenase family)